MNPLARRPASSRGLSLIEAAVVTCICAVAVTSAVPSFGRFIDQQRLEGRAGELATDLQWVRTEAVSRNRPVRLSVYPSEAGSCYLVHTGPSALCSCAADGLAGCSSPAVELKTVQWRAADRVQLGATAHSLLFDPLHGTSTPAGSFNVSIADGRTIRHVVNLMGRVRSCAPGAAVPGYPSC